MNSALKELEDGEEQNVLIHINYEDAKNIWEEVIHIEDRQRRSNTHTTGVPEAGAKE